MAANKDLNDDPHLENFWRSSRILRAWLVAFGVGLPAIVLTNERLFDGLVKAGMARWVFGLIFAAVGLQILVEFWLKYRHWANYVSGIVIGSEGPERKGEYGIWGRKFVVIYELNFVISVVIDISSIGLLGAAGVIAIFTCIDSGTAAAITDAAATMTDAAATMPALQ